MQHSLHDFLCIVGPQHSGKSLLGSMIARSLSLSHVDLDERVLMHAEKINGTITSVRELYKTSGKEMFQQWECIAFEGIENESTKKKGPLVLSCGGGIADNQAVWTAVRRHMVIALTIDPVISWNRLGLHSATDYDPALLPAYVQGSKQPFEKFVALITKRNEIYRQGASLVLNGAQDPDILCDVSLEYIKKAVGYTI